MIIPFKVLTLTSLLVLATTASAAVPRIIRQAEAEEAQRIEVYLTQGESGYAVIQGCTHCPLKLDVDTKTRFFFQNKPVSHDMLKGISGGAGTVIHDKGAVIRIRWDTDAARNK